MSGGQVRVGETHPHAGSGTNPTAPAASEEGGRANAKSAGHLATAPQEVGAPDTAVHLERVAAPHLLDRLTAMVRPKGLHGPTAARFASEGEFFNIVAANLRAGAWREVKGAPCPRNVDGGTDGVALVLDRHDKVRAFTTLGGTGDHYHELRLFFDDDEHVRLLFLKLADVAGGASEQLVAIDAGGGVRACENRSESVGLPELDLCADDRGNGPVDSKVNAVLRERPEGGSSNRKREELRSLVPQQEFERCIGTEGQ